MSAPSPCDPAAPLVEVSDLWRIYRPGSAHQAVALRGVNLALDRGRLVTLAGRSGSGKTTLLNYVGGLDRPTSGAARVAGRDLTALDEREITRFRRQKLGFVFQSFGLLPTFSAYENVELVLRLAGASPAGRRERAEQVLGLVGLRDWMEHRPEELSGGQQQRVAIGRALASRPALLLADEPTGELDSATAREILALFRQIVTEERLTLLVATHDPLVSEYADQVLHLSDGRILSPGESGRA